MKKKNKLDIWIEKNKLSQKELAARLDICRSHMCGILRGKRYLGKKTAKKIQEITGGYVRARKLIIENRRDFAEYRRKKDTEGKKDLK
jgi:transcriptional regulator with XRE-family HTH domain